MKHELLTIETWRLDRLFNEYGRAVSLFVDQLPPPWDKIDLRLFDADTHAELNTRLYAITGDVLAYAQEHAGRGRAACPLCGRHTTSGSPFALPVGLERHLNWYRDHSCIVLDLLFSYYGYRINTKLKRPLLTPFS